MEYRPRLDDTGLHERTVTMIQIKVVHRFWVHENLMRIEGMLGEYLYGDLVAFQIEVGKDQFVYYLGIEDARYMEPLLENLQLLIKS